MQAQATEPSRDPRPETELIGRRLAGRAVAGLLWAAVVLLVAALSTVWA
jgi:uncharacterized RDD family membrane protein YckC